MRIHFNLKAPGDSKSIVFVKFTLHSQQKRFSTGLKVSTKRWDKDRQRLSGRTKEAAEINPVLDKIEENIIKCYLDSQPSTETKRHVNNAIAEAQGKPQTGGMPVLAGSPFGFYKSIKTPDKELQNQSAEKQSIADAIDNHIEKNRLVLSEGRIRHYRSFKNTLKRFGLDVKKVEEWKKEDFEILRDELIKQGIKDNTALTKIKLLRAVLRGIDEQHEALSFKFTANQQFDNPTLTEEELDQIRQTEFSGKLEKTKDLFLFQCLTGQRISDILKQRKTDITGNVWRITQQKTKKRVQIPLTREALDILEKYDYSLPKLSQQKHNDHLKEMAKKAQLNRWVHIERSSGNKEQNSEGPIFKFMASHMGRRIFITHSLNRGVPVNVVSRVSGNSMRELQKYEQTQNDEIRKYYT